MLIGYTSGVFDLFHAGHVRLLQNAKSMCDRLVVGVTVDELVEYKGKRSVIGYEQRREVVLSCRFVDAVVPQYDMDKVSMVRKLGARIMFVGDDWYGTEKWSQYEQELRELACGVVYFPYMRGTSSTIINEALRSIREGNG